MTITNETILSGEFNNYLSSCPQCITNEKSCKQADQIVKEIYNLVKDNFVQSSSVYHTVFEIPNDNLVNIIRKCHIEFKVTVEYKKRTPHSSHYYDLLISWTRDNPIFASSSFKDRRLEKLWQRVVREEGCDVIIEAKDNQFLKAHRLILTTNSKYFKSADNVSCISKAPIKIDASKKIVMGMLEFIYKGSITALKDFSPDEIFELFTVSHSQHSKKLMNYALKQWDSNLNKIEIRIHLLAIQKCIYNEVLLQMLIWVEYKHQDSVFDFREGIFGCTKEFLTQLITLATENNFHSVLGELSTYMSYNPYRDRQ